MKHGTKELLKTIISNQELMMKALNIQPVKKEVVKASKSPATKTPAKPVVKSSASRPVVSDTKSPTGSADKTKKSVKKSSRK